MSAGTKFQIIRELFSFLLQNKRWWLVPMILVMLFLGVLVFIAQQSAVAPFIYALF